MRPAADQTSIVELLKPSEAYGLLRATAGQAEALGARPFLVGGAVRDLLLGRPSLDLDVVVEGDAVAVATALAEAKGGEAAVHRQFGTATVKIGGQAIDLATARTETYASPGALPEVQPATISEDLRRRDFTINAIAASLSASSFGEIVDPLGGRADLDTGLLRVMHDQSFADDATRILRAFRYQARFGMALEPHTAELLRGHAGMLRTISGDRVRHELERIFQEAAPEQALELASEAGALQAIHPALAWDGNLSEQAAHARDEGHGEAGLYLALVGLRMSEGDAGEAAGRLALSGGLSRIFTSAPRLAALREDIEEPGLSRSRLFDILSVYDDRAIVACRIASDSRIMKERLLLYLEELTKVQPVLDGNDLLALGVPQGPHMGRVLAELQRARLDGEVETKSGEESLVGAWLEERQAQD